MIFSKIYMYLIFMLQKINKFKPYIFILYYITLKIYMSIPTPEVYRQMQQVFYGFTLKNNKIVHILSNDRLGETYL